ncbi:hypothetical protein [Halohasta litchfieldiae]|nr:hypothetical protein [Halohasta litchfieldiae]
MNQTDKQNNRQTRENHATADKTTDHRNLREINPTCSGNEDGDDE